MANKLNFKSFIQLPENMMQTSVATAPPGTPGAVSQGKPDVDDQKKQQLVQQAQTELSKTQALSQQPNIDQNILKQQINKIRDLSKKITSLRANDAINDVQTQLQDVKSKMSAKNPQNQIAIENPN